MLAFSAISLLVVLQTAFASPLLEKDIIARQAPAAVSLAKTSNYLELTSNPASNVVASSRAVSKYGSAKLRATLYSQIWSAKVKVGGETVLLILDTGSSDTFLIHKGYQCVDSHGVIQSQETCAAPAYNGSFMQGPIKGVYAEKSPSYVNPPLTYKLQQNFYKSYGDGTFASDLLGYQDLTIGGIKVKNQEIGLVNRTFWEGDGYGSGLLGLAFPASTAAYVGDDPNIDNRTEAGSVKPGDRMFYSPLVQTMISQGLNPPLFSLAMQRVNRKSLNDTGSANAPGGFVAFGGLPPVAVDSAFATTPTLIHKYPNYSNSPYSATNYTYYSIQIDGYVYNNAKGKATTHAQQDIGIVDSGATCLYLPSSVADSWYATFDPPTVYNETEENNYYPCNGTIPYLGIKIAGTVFQVDARDIVSPPGVYGYTNSTDGLEYCLIEVFGGQAPFPFVLGSVFLAERGQCLRLGP